MVDFSSPKGAKKCIYTTIKHCVHIILTSEDCRLEGILEDMHVNWEIIKEAIAQEAEEIKQLKEADLIKTEGVFSDPSHRDSDQIKKHNQKKDVMVKGGISTELVKKSVEARKRLVGLEGLI